MLYFNTGVQPLSALLNVDTQPLNALFNHTQPLIALFNHRHSTPQCFALTQTLNPSITNVRNAIDKSLAERDSNIDKFCTHLDKDITELGKEVKEVKQEAQVSVCAKLPPLNIVYQQHCL